MYLLLQSENVNQPFWYENLKWIMLHLTNSRIRRVKVGSVVVKTRDSVRKHPFELCVWGLSCVDRTYLGSITSCEVTGQIAPLPRFPACSSSDAVGAICAWLLIASTLTFWSFIEKLPLPRTAVQQFLYHQYLEGNFRRAKSAFDVILSSAKQIYAVGDVGVR